MPRKYIFAVIVFLAVITPVFFRVLPGRVSQESPALRTTAPQAADKPADCAYDCGRGGWQKMRETCGLRVSDRDGLKNCLTQFEWTAPHKDITPAKMETGYIEIGGSNILAGPTPAGIKVFIYIRWAADQDGNLYLRSEVG